jgi:serine/threonine-protein kinase
MRDDVLAAKVFHRDLAWNEVETKECLAYFENEAHWLTRLKHPNLVKGFGTHVIKGQMAILLEFIPGMNLRQWLDANPPPRALPLFFQLAQGITMALRHLHEQGLMHRDVAPRNVMVTSGHETILIDLQFVRKVPAASDSQSRALSTEIGDWAFAAPELMDGLDETYDARVDIYSLGALLIELLVGRPPRRRQPVMCRPDVPKNLSDLLWRMVSEVPSERPTWEEITTMFVPPALRK